MNKLQEKELCLLKEFIRVCDSLGLEYFLVCGSCLGAVKYGGFIPWDDDLDVALPRKDYTVFIEKAQALLPEGLFLQNFRTDRYFPQFFSKLRDSATTFIEKSAKHIDMNHGIYIDIFPLDGYPRDSSSAEELERFKKEYSRKLATVFDTENASVKVKALAAFRKLLHVNGNYRDMIVKADSLFSSYGTEGSDLWCNHGNWQGALEYAPAVQYGSGTDSVFEGVKVRIPEKYDEYLTRKYGDWRADLPEEEKRGHHYHEILDTERSYKEYTRPLPGGKLEIINKMTEK